MTGDGVPGDAATGVVSSGAASRGAAGADEQARRPVVVLPASAGDPGRPSGGSHYDLRVLRELADRGVAVRRHLVDGEWPRPDAAARTALDRILAERPDGSPVLIDGLVACGVPDVLVPHCARLAVVVLVHLPLADETGLPPAVAAALDAAEGQVLRAVAAVVATSAWAADRLAVRHRLDTVTIAPPGVDPGPLAPGTTTGRRLLCPAALTPRKGHDVLLDALAQVPDLVLECAGAPGPAAEPVRVRAAAPDLTGRVALLGPLGRAALDARYADADLVVLASRTETYGMVVTEALARGLPVLTTTAGPLPATVGAAPDGTVPGLLVAPDDPAALAVALRRWRDEPELRARLRRAAAQRRAELPGWDTTAAILTTALGAAARCRRGRGASPAGVVPQAGPGAAAAQAGRR